MVGTASVCDYLLERKARGAAEERLALGEEGDKGVGAEGRRARGREAARTVAEHRVLEPTMVTVVCAAGVHDLGRPQG